MTSRLPLLKNNTMWHIAHTSSVCGCTSHWGSKASASSCDRGGMQPSPCVGPCDTATIDSVYYSLARGGDNVSSLHAAVARMPDPIYIPHGTYAASFAYTDPHNGIPGLTLINSTHHDHAEPPFKHPSLTSTNTDASLPAEAPQGTSSGRRSDITPDVLRSVFHMPINDAAKELGIGVTVRA